MRKIDQKTICARWLEDRLSEGPVRSDIVRAEAEAKNWSYTTLLRAANDLDVLSDSRSDHFQRRTFWSLPNDSA